MDVPSHVNDVRLIYTRSTSSLFQQTGTKSVNREVKDVRRAECDGVYYSPHACPRSAQLLHEMAHISNVGPLPSVLVSATFDEQGPSSAVPKNITPRYSGRCVSPLSVTFVLCGSWRKVLP